MARIKDNVTPQVKALVKHVEEKCGTDDEGAIRDILTELMHLCSERGYDFFERVDAANEVYEEECDEEKYDEEISEDKDRKNGLYGPEYKGEQF